MRLEEGGEGRGDTKTTTTIMEAGLAGGGGGGGGARGKGERRGTPAELVIVLCVPYRKSAMRNALQVANASKNNISSGLGFPGDGKAYNIEICYTHYFPDASSPCCLGVCR